MARGDRNYSHGRMGEAAQAYGEAAATADREVDADEALYRQAQALENAGRPEQAIALLDQVAARQPESRRTARALFEASLIRIRTGQPDAGYAGLRRVTLEYSASGSASRALFLLVQHEKEARGQDSALALVRSIEAQVRTTELGDDALMLESRLCDEASDSACSKQALARIVREYPYPFGQRWDDALTRLADLAEAEHDFERAAQYLEQLLAVHENTSTPGSYTLPRMPEASIRVARLYRTELHDNERALDAYWRAYDDFPYSRFRDDALFEIGEIYLQTNRGEKACDMFERVMDEFAVGHARRKAAELRAAQCH